MINCLIEKKILVYRKYTTATIKIINKATGPFVIKPKPANKPANKTFLILFLETEMVWK